MTPRRKFPSADDIADLRNEVVELSDHIRALMNAIDEVRDLVSWVTRNGIPSGPSSPDHFTLKRMAADPNADDWNERLLIDRGTREEALNTKTGSSTSLAPELADRRATNPSTNNDSPGAESSAPLFEEGDTVEFTLDGVEEFGEILSIDIVHNEATILLIPSEAEVIVPLDNLVKVEPEEFEDEKIDDGCEASAAVHSTVQDTLEEGSSDTTAIPQSKPPHGKLFIEPGDQARLF